MPTDYIPNGYQTLPNALSFGETLTRLISFLPDGRVVFVANSTTTPIEALVWNTDGTVSLNFALNSYTLATLPSTHRAGEMAWVTDGPPVGLYFDNGSAWSPVSTQALKSYTISTLPVAGTAGRLSFVSDGNPIGLYIDNGTAWVPVPTNSKFPTYTTATLPATSTAGRLAYVSDQVSGLWLDGGASGAWRPIGLGIIDPTTPPYNASVGGVVDARAALAAADTASALGVFILPPGNYLVSSNLTITNPLIMLPHAVFVIPNGVTLTINGLFMAGPIQVFSTSGTGAVVFGQGFLTEVYPEWWGVDGTADDVQINQAIEAVKVWHGITKLLNKIYNITGSIQYRTGTKLIGSSKGASSGSAFDTLIISRFNSYAIAAAASTESTDIFIENLKLKLDASGGALPNTGGVNIEFSSNSVIRNVSVILASDNSTRAAYRIARTGSAGGFYNRIENCHASVATSHQFTNGLLFEGSANQNVIDQLNISKCVTGVLVTGAHNELRSLNSETMSSHHIKLSGASATYGNHLIHSPYMDGDAITYPGVIGIEDDATIKSVVVAPHYANLTTRTVGVGPVVSKQIKGSFKIFTVDATPASQTIALDASEQNAVRIEATTNNNFTINNPTNPDSVDLITFIILNSCGGSMGTITWGDGTTQFKLAGAFTNPANTKYRLITFRRFGSIWLEESRTDADIDP